MALSDFNHIKSVLTALNTLRPSRFGYRQEVLDAPELTEVSLLTGVYAPEDSSQINSIPTPEQTALTDVVTAIGLRSQAATLSRMMINHFFGRMSLNMVKLTEKVKLLVSEHLVNRYINSSGKVVESISISVKATTIEITQNQSNLADSAPGNTATVLVLPAAVSEGNAGMMTGADKKVLDDVASVGLASKQPLDSDLTAIAGLTPADNDVIQRISGSWVNRTMAQLKTALALVKGDVGLGNVTNESKATMFTSPTFTGNLPVLPAADPTTANQAVRKSYVDSKIYDVRTNYHSTWGNFNVNGSVLYALFAPYLPNIGDNMIVSGVWIANSKTCIATHARRSSSTIIELHGFCIADGGIYGFGVDSTDTTKWSGSISW